MRENDEEMVKNLYDALVNADSEQEVSDLCNQIILLDPENPNAKVMKAVILMEQYWESKIEESLDDYDDDSLDEVYVRANKVLELLTGITRTDEITEEIKHNFSSMYGDFLDEWGRQTVKHGSKIRDRLSKQHSESLLMQIVALFPSHVERQQRKNMKFFLEKIALLSWLQSNPMFLEELSLLYKSRTVGYKTLKNVTKLLIKLNKGIDKKSEAGVAVKKLKKAFRIRKLLRNIVWYILLAAYFIPILFL